MIDEDVNEIARGIAVEQVQSHIVPGTRPPQIGSIDLMVHNLMNAIAAALTARDARAAQRIRELEEQREISINENLAQRARMAGWARPR